MAFLPAAILWLPSSRHLLRHCKDTSTSDLFFFILTPASPLLPSCRQTSLIDTEMTQAERASSESDDFQLKIELLLNFLAYKITKSKAQQFQTSVTCDKRQKCVWTLRSITYCSSILNGSSHLEMCLGAACPRGQKIPRFDCKQLCLNLLVSTVRA